MDESKNPVEPTLLDHNLPLKGEIDMKNENSDVGERSMNPGSNAVQFEREIEKKMIREEIIASEMLRRQELEDEVRRELMIDKQLRGMRNLYGQSYVNDSSNMLTSYGVLGPRYGPNYDEYLMTSGLSNDQIERRMKLMSGSSDEISEPMLVNLNSRENHVMGREEENRQMEEVVLGKQPFDRNLDCVTPVAEKHNAEETVADEVMAEAMPAAGIVGMKRKAETPARACDEETTPVPLTVPIDSQKWFCTVCQVSTTSEGTLNAHFQGKKHKAKKARSNANGTTDIISMASNTADNSAPPSQSVNLVGTTKWDCSLCQLSLTSEMHLISHRQGKKHKAKEAKVQAGVIMANAEEFRPLKSQEMSVALDNATGNAIAVNADNQWYCSLCGVSASSENNLKDHLKGKKHKAKAGLPEQVIVEMGHESTGKGSGVEITKKANMKQESLKTVSEVEVTTLMKETSLDGETDEGIVKMDQESTEKTSRVVVIKEKRMEGDDSPKHEQKESNPNTQFNKDEKTELELMADSKKPEMLPTDAKELEKGGDENMEFVKYWHCKMCNQGTHDEATMAAHRKGVDHMTLLKKHGGGLISVMNVPKVEQKFGNLSKEELCA